jgi:multimeric flavodoxin WrbA
MAAIPAGCVEEVGVIIMGKRIVVVNAGPRKGWNTDILLSEAAKGAEEAGAEIIRFDLFKLERYTGCISCFGCKREKFKGHCICKDGLTPVLDAIRESDGLIIGSPNYLSNVTASFRALYERLIFQNLTYNRENPCCKEKDVPVLFIMTSNAPDTMYSDLLNSYQQTFSAFVGPCDVLVSGDTLQVADYSKLDWEWTMFDPDKKKERRETVFPEECKKAFEMGKSLAER